MLLTKVKNICKKDSKERTFLHHAVIFGEAKHIEGLLETVYKCHGTKKFKELLDGEDKNLNTPMLLAIKRKSPKIVKLFLQWIGAVYSDSKNIPYLVFVPIYHAFLGEQ